MKRIRCVSAISALGIASVNLAMAADTTPPAPSVPPYTALRYDENYSYLKSPDAPADFFDPIKRLSLDGDGDSYLTLGGQVRDRYEYFQNNTFGSGKQDDSGFNLVRVMLNADLHLGPYFRAFVQGISATEQGRIGGARASDRDDIDLHQGFLELTLPITADSSLGFRAGRQVIVFGAQRLIGVSDWTNVRKTDDAARVTLTTPGNTVDVFYARPVRVVPIGLDDETPKTYFAGIYETLAVPGDWAKEMKAKVEAYALYDNRRSITFNTTTSGEDRYTLGTRLTASPGHFDFDLEPDYQIGRFHEQETHSYSLAALAGYTFDKAMFAPRPFVGFDIASGGKKNRPGDAFDQLFPSGHDQFGIIDAIGRQNIIDVHPGFTLNLLENQPMAKRLTLLTQYRQFWRESDQDAVYTSSGTILRTAGTSGARGVGGEADVQLNWQLDRHISSYVGYCHFFRGAFIDATGPHQDIDFAYSAVAFTF